MVDVFHVKNLTIFFHQIVNFSEILRRILSSVKSCSNNFRSPIYDHFCCRYFRYLSSILWSFFIESHFIYSNDNKAEVDWLGSAQINHIHFETANPKTKLAITGKPEKPRSALDTTEEKV